MPKSSSILYVASRLPCRSETFVYREVVALRSHGVRILTASLRQPESGLGEPELEKMAAESIVVYGSFARLIADVFSEAVLNLKRTARTFLAAFRDGFWEENKQGVYIFKILIQAAGGISLSRRIRGLGVSRIHCHLAHAPATVAMYAAMQSCIPFSFTGHGADVFRDGSLLKQKLSRAAQVVCISRWHREVYQRIHARPVAQYPLVRCGVDTETQSAGSDARQAAIPGGEALPLILTVARLVPKKGVHLLVQALARLHCAGRRFRAVVAGDGPELNSLQKLAVHCGVSGRIEWKGALIHSEVTALMRGASVFVLPCVIADDGDRDGIPVVLMEAMAVGVPCVSSDFPAIRELIEDGVSGRLIAPADVKELARAIEELISDSSLRARICFGGREAVSSEFSTRLNGHRLLDVFQGEREVVS